MLNIRTILRDYQIDAVNAVIDSVRSGVKRPIVSVPTGGGKTVILSCIANELSDLQILVITPRRKLLQQTANWLKDAGILSGNLGVDDGSKHRIVIGTYQTLIRREFKMPELVIVDEAHLLPLEDESTYKQMIDGFGDVPVVGLTATPIRGSVNIIDDVNWTSCYSIGIIDLIKKGHLVPPMSIGCGDEVLNESQDLCEITDRILPRLFESFKTQKVKNPIIFCQDIAHATHVIRCLHTMKKPAALIHSQLSQSLIDKRWDEYSAGGITLVNVNIATIGCDIPICDGIVILRNIHSLSTFIQVVGRGIRPSPNKTHCCVYDFGEATKKFGSLVFPDLMDDKQSGISSVRVKCCPCCEYNNSLQTRFCANCGYKFLFKSHIHAKSSTESLLGDEYSYKTVASVIEAGGIFIGQCDDGMQVHSKTPLRTGQVLLCKEKVLNLCDIIQYID